MSGTRPSAAVRHSTSAATCGTPKFVLSRRRAAAAGADADLDAVDAAVDEEADAVGGGDVAGDQLDVAELLPEGSTARAITTEWPWAMSMTMTSAPARSSSVARSR